MNDLPLPCDAHWVVLRRRASLAGSVLRGEGGTVVGASGGTVQLSALASEDAAATGPVPVVAADAWVVQTPIRPTGAYVFFDLAPGDYLTGGCDERGSAIEAKRVTVQPPDRTRRPVLPAFDLLVARPVRGSSKAPAIVVAAA